MKVINIQEAKTHLSRFVDAAHRGEEFLIGKHGTPMARLVPYTAKASTRPLGGLEGQLWISDDFDEADPRIQQLFEGA